MRLCYVSNAVLGSHNASAVHVVKMCNALAGVFDVVHVVSQVADDSDKLESVYGKFDFSLIRVPGGKITNLRKIAASIFCSYGADVVYSRWVSFMPLFFLLGRKIRVLELHSIPVSHAFRFGMLLERYFNGDTKFVFITAQLKTDFLALFPFVDPVRCCVFPDGADPAIGSIAQDKYIETLKICGYVGSFKPGKGVDVVLALASCMPDFSFVVVGGEPDEISKYKRDCPSNVEFVGYVPPLMLEAEFGKFSIALLPNQNEVLVEGKNIGEWTSPLKMFEYMSNGKTVIASDLPVLQEVLVDNLNSLLVPPGDLLAWELAIRKVAGDPDFGFRLAKVGLNDFIHQYSWATRAKKVVKFLEML